MGTPQSSNLMGFSIINIYKPSILGIPISGHLQMPSPQKKEVWIELSTNLHPICS